MSFQDIWKKWFCLIGIAAITTCSVSAQSTIAQQDFDGGTPEWSYRSNHNFFSHTGSNTQNNVYPAEDGWDDDGFYGVVSNSEWSQDLGFSGFSGHILGITDLDDEGDFGTENTARLTFEKRNISGYQNVSISFDHELSGFGSNDFIKYEVFEDGQGQGLNSLSGSGSPSINVSSSTRNVQLVFRLKQNSKSEYAGLDNVKLEGTAKNQSQPANQPTNFAANALSNGKIELTWTDATGSPAPHGYLIKAEKTGSISQPTDGNDPSVDKDLSDGSAVVKVGHGAGGTYTFSNLDRNTKYDFKIWSFTNAENNIDFLNNNGGTSGKTASATTLVNEPIRTESFETNAGYTFPNGNGVSGQNVFDQVDLVTYDNTTDYIYSNFDQDHFIAGEDVDAAIGTRDGIVRINNVDITGFRNLKVKGAFAAGANGGYETDDEVLVEARIDGGSWQSVLTFEGNGSKELAQVSTGDQLKGAFRDFIGSVSGTGDVLDLRITLSFNAGSEEAAVDNIRITGEPPKKWDGQASGNKWSSANNWEPNGVPQSNDVVVLDDTHVPGNYTVHLDQNVSNTAIESLKIKPANTQSIDVGRAGNLGTFELQSSGTALRMDAGGRFIDSTSSGLPTFTNSGDILVKSNGTYQISNNSRSVSTGSLVDALASASSVDGEVKYETNGGSLSVSGQTYPTSLILTIKSGTNDFNTSGGNPFTVEGDFTIGSDVTYDATGRSAGGDLIVKGNLTVNGTLNMSNQQALEMAGSGSQQTIKGLSSLTSLTVNNSSGVQLNQNLTVNNTLTLTDGVISFKNTSDRLTIADNATVSGAGNSSYVDGTVDKIGDEAFDFPVGANGVLAEIGISAPASATDEFSVTYFDQKPGNANSIASSHPAGKALKNVSTKRYWDLKRVNGSSNVDVTLYWTNQTNNAIKDTGTLVVAHENNNNKWENLGKDAANGSVSGNGSITKNNVSSFSNFTYGSTDASANPLPVELLHFKAMAMEGKVALHWATASETNNKHFQVQKQVGGEWELIGTVKGNGTTTQKHTYDFEDPHVEAGQTYYYRLKQVDFDGSYEYSDVKAVTLSRDEASQTSALAVYPNPVGQTLNVAFTGNGGNRLRVTICSAQGQMVYRNEWDTENEALRKALPVSGLQPGAYVLMLKGQNRVYRQRFLKR